MAKGLNIGINTVASVAVIVIGLPIAYNNLQKARDTYIQQLYNEAIYQADSNRDGRLQREELTDLLKKIELECKLANHFRVYYTKDLNPVCETSSGSTTVLLSMPDIRKYLYGEER